MTSPPSDQTIRDIVSAANRAPSADNCQPWRFDWDGQTLRVFHVEERGRHALDHCKHASFITLGCVAESIVLASQRHSLDAHPQFTWAAANQTGEWLTVDFSPASSRDIDPLASCLELRWTERSPFAKAALPKTLADQMRAEADRFDTISLWTIEAIPQALVDYLCAIDAFIWVHRNAHRDLMKWLRFSRQETERTRNGMPWETLGISFLESRLLKACRRYAVQQIMNKLGFLAASRHTVRKQLHSSSALFCLTLRDPQPSGLFTVGRAGMRLWLLLNSAAFGVQPLTLGSLSVYDVLTGALPGDTRPRFVELFKGGREILSRSFGLGEHDIPVWLFRTGPSDRPDQNRLTLRLETATLLTFAGRSGRAE